MITTTASNNPYLADAFPRAKPPTQYWQYADPAQRAAAYAEQMGQAGTVQSPAAAHASQAASDAMFRPVQQLTEGRANELRSDPVNQQIIQYLQSIMGGNNVPYNDQTLNALKAQYGKGTASAEAAQMDELRNAVTAGGGSIYDPSFQAASREAMSNRQGQNLDYAGQLGAEANAANFGARQGAANQLAAVNANQNAQINNLGLAGAGYEAQRFQETPGGGLPTTLMPQYAPQAAQSSAAMGPRASGGAPAPARMTARPQAAPQAPTGSAQLATTAQPRQAPNTGLSQDQLPNSDPFNIIRGIMNQGYNAQWA